MLQPAPVQLTYQQYLPIAQNGMLASEINWTADTRIVEPAAGIGFGLAVGQGTLSDKGIAFNANFRGVTRADVTLARADLYPNPPVLLDIYSQWDNAGVLVMGDIWVNVYGTVTPTGPVTYDTATGRFGLAGTTVTIGRWMTSAVGTGTAPALAVLRLANISGQ